MYSFPLCLSARNMTILVCPGNTAKRSVKRISADNGKASSLGVTPSYQFPHPADRLLIYGLLLLKSPARARPRVPGHRVCVCVCVTLTACHGGLCFPHDSLQQEKATFHASLYGRIASPNQKKPRLMCNRPPSFRHSPHRFPIPHPTHPPISAAGSAGPFTPGALPRDVGHGWGQLVDLPESFL